VTSTAATTAKIYEDPIKLATVSTTAADRIVYDENNSCGSISISAAPGDLTDL